MGKVFKSPVCDGLRVFASFFSRHSGGLGVGQDIFCPAGRWDGPFFSRLIVAAFSDFAIRHKVPQFFFAIRQLAGSGHKSKQCHCH